MATDVSAPHRLRLYFHLLPMFGLVPSLLYLGRRGGDRDLRRASRLSLSLGGGWVLAYVLCNFASLPASEVMAFRLLFLNSLVTSGYILGCFFLMWQYWQQGNLRPVLRVSRFQDRHSP